MSRVRLLHWKAAEATAYIESLTRAKHRVEYDEQFESALMKSWRVSPPDAFIIDLSRLPSHGREIAIALRQSPRTRHVPIVFCNGPKQKLDRIRTELPDAVFCSPAELLSSLTEALANPPRDPVKPVGMMNRYATRTAAQKLAITESSIVAVIDPPRNFPELLGELPGAVEFLDEAAPNASVTLCFVQAAPVLASALSTLRRRAGKTKLWVLWRKGGSAARGDVTERLVRDTGLRLGLVDYKICSVDEVWSAMLFAAKQ